MLVLPGDPRATGLPVTARTPCQACGQPIVWALGRTGRRMPLNATPDPAGNVELHADGRAVVHKTAPLTGVDLYTSHFATCPNAAEFRRARPQRKQT